MKVLLVGGAGVFGSRLAELLVRDGHDVTLAGRRLAAVQAAAGAIGLATNTEPGFLAFDRTGPLTALAGFDAVIDAAGPFQAHGDDPYRLARAAIAEGIHYLDLSDDPEFTAGISALHDAAVTAGTIAFSGVSSVPALSAAAAAAMAPGFDEVVQIESAILPGNRAPRGRAVVESILSQVGGKTALSLDGADVRVATWSRPRRYDLGSGMKRTAHLIGVPDVRLFPRAFGVPTVLFRAGLELWPMRAGLSAWRAVGRTMPGVLRRAAHAGAWLLRPFGSDQGGMVVELTGRKGQNWHRKTWRLRVTDGQGPFIPGVAARALLRNDVGLRPGAGAAIGVVTLSDVTRAMSDINAVAEIVEDRPLPLFRRFLGAEFDALAPEVQASHDSPAVRVLSGQASVTRGTGLLARLIALAFRFPAEAPAVPVTVIKWPDGAGGEIWERCFGDQTFLSHLRGDKGEMTERFGPITFRLDLNVKEARLHFPVQGARVGVLPLPRFLWPKSIAVETAKGEGQGFDVALHAPLTGELIVRYRGVLNRSGAGPAPEREHT